MASDGSGTGLWKQVSAVRLREDGSLQAPVRANRRQGIVVGVDQVSASDAADAVPAPPPATHWWTRLTRKQT